MTASDRARLALASTCTVVLALGWTRPCEASKASSGTRAAAPDPRDERLLQVCGAGHATLHHAARHVALRVIERKQPPTMVELRRWLRAWGEPHPGARAWTLRSEAVDRDHAHGRLQSWLAQHDAGTQRVCGVASVQDSEQGEVVAVVAVPVFADLAAPLPSRVPPGQWLTVEARMRTLVEGAKVVVIGPRGAPRTVPASFDPRTRRVVGRFMADRAGSWLVQVVATTPTGPRPVIEAQVRVGEGDGGEPAQAPGEEAGAGLPDDDALFAKLNAARRAEGLRPLVRDRRLDDLAEAHVRHMMSSGLVAHDAGDGTPLQRAADAGIEASEVGENVSRATSVSLAHRALWSSPSHRSNTLHPRYERVGVAALRDVRGRVWVTQVFVGREVSR